MNLTMNWAIPIDDEIDPSSVRTSQRAELLAAIHGIYELAEFESDSNEARAEHRDSNDKVTWVITSDSEYVVLGMTEWVPAWKVGRTGCLCPSFLSHLSEQRNGWRNSSRKRPKNLDLFQRLDAAVERYEREYGVRIAFWRISRVYNGLADELAGVAAGGQTIELVQFEYVYRA